MSHDATTWFTSLYTFAEVVGMALAPWFERLEEPWIGVTDIEEEFK